MEVRAPNGFDFFRPHGWSPTVRRPFFAEARRLGREGEMRFAWLVRALSSLSGRFRRRMENLVVYGVVNQNPGNRWRSAVSLMPRRGSS